MREQQTNHRLGAFYLNKSVWGGGNYMLQKIHEPDIKSLKRPDNCSTQSWCVSCTGRETKVFQGHCKSVEKLDTGSKLDESIVLLNLLML